MRFAFLLAALFLASLNLRPAITSVSPLLGTIRDALGISNSVVSLLTSLPVLCMGLFAPAAVKLSLRFGIERTITLCLALIGVATVLRFWADTAWMMLLTAFLAGVGIAITGPLLSGFIKKHFTNPSAIVGIYSMALVVGAALGAGLAVPLQNSFGTWQASVSFWGILAVIALIFWLRLTRQDSPAMKAAAISAAAAPVAGKAASGSRLPLRNRRAWLLTSFFGAMALIFYSLTAWIAPIVQEMGYDKQTAGTILTLFTLIQIPVSFFIPILVSRFQHRMLWLVGCAALELIGLIMLQTSVTPWLTCIVLGIAPAACSRWHLCFQLMRRPMQLMQARCPR